MQKNIRNAKAVNGKAKAHQVTELADGIFEVKSATSGKVYRVELWQDRSICNCNWGQYHHDNSACSHVQAAYEWLANREGRTTSAWASQEDAKRQHKRMIDLGNGVTLTLRKA